MSRPMTQQMGCLLDSYKKLKAQAVYCKGLQGEEVGRVNEIVCVI